MICGAGSDYQWPDVGNTELPCCYGSALDGPTGCTCWVPVFDIDQAPADPTAPIETREGPCGDCAYRADSPERTTDEAAMTEDELLALTHGDVPFWCHDGMRRPTGYLHTPSGTIIPGEPDDYQPLQVGAQPYRADGRPALRCAGWAARRARSQLPEETIHG